MHVRFATIESGNRKSIYLLIVGINTRLLGNDVNNYGGQRSTFDIRQQSAVKNHVPQKQIPQNY